MQKSLLLSFMFATVAAQTTAIPDAAFEQVLINKGIDSDGLVNGQVSTTDVSGVTELTIDMELDIMDMTGLQDFSSLENLSVTYTQISNLDVSQNTQLKVLNCSSNMLTALDVSSNLLLEELYIFNSEDVGPFNNIVELDLSHNPNLNTVYLYNNWALEKVNLKNGNNNPDMSLQISLGFMDPPHEPVPDQIVCVEIDDEELAQTNSYPYSEWDIESYYTTIIFTEECTMSAHRVEQPMVTVYPNPARDVLTIDVPGDMAVENVLIMDMGGRVVQQYNAPGQSIPLSGLAQGLYLVKVFSGTVSSVHKVLINP